MVSHARKHRSAKREDNARQVPLDDALTVCENRAEEMLAIDEALMRLAAMDPQTGAACQVALLWADAGGRDGADSQNLRAHREAALEFDARVAAFANIQPIRGQDA